MYNERQKEMIKYLSEVKFARAEQLSERFQVSLETVRRDLMVLDPCKCLKKNCCIHYYINIILFLFFV